MGFWNNFKEQFKNDCAKQSIKISEKSQRIKEMDEKGIPYCPKCFSTSVQPFKKGFGIGKAAVGTLLVGPLGLLGGAIGKNKIQMHCLMCGNKYKA